jgi:hypothetical protein
MGDDRYQENSAVKLKERWVTRTLSGLYFQRRTSHQNLAWSIGSFLLSFPLPVQRAILFIGEWVGTDM